MNLQDSISSLKKYRNSITYYKNNKELISKEGMNVDSKVVYISVLNDFDKHIDKEIISSKDSILKQLLSSSNENSIGYIAMNYFVSILFVLVLIIIVTLTIYYIRGV